MAKRPAPISRQRTIMLAGKPYVLRRDFRSMVAFEDLTGVNIGLFVTTAQTKAFTSIAQLLFALTATHRRETGEGEMTFDEFLGLLPDLEEFQKLSEIAFGLLTETSGGDSGNAEAPSDAATAD